MGRVFHHCLACSIRITFTLLQFLYIQITIHMFQMQWTRLSAFCDIDVCLAIDTSHSTTHFGLFSPDINPASNYFLERSTLLSTVQLSA